MTKRIKEMPEHPDPTEDEEYTAAVLTVLLKTVNPSIKEDLVYPMLLSCLQDGLTEQTVEECGLAIRATAFEKSGLH